ncbi:TolC family protein [Clostridium sp. YIM B02555]|uniref:TolC family protein n=1 Tax=Clostridium sp. YIM B02555 TaxID=2911968 RepID=UPI001EEEFD20|nr:TolC family protein [Clostridium sp. YIM B02555]
MRKNINKMVAFAIGISVMSGSIVPVFAADTTQQASNTVTSTQTVSGKPLFTLDEAIKASISNSDILAIDNKKVSYQDKVNDVNERIEDITPNLSSDKKDLNKDTRNNSLDQAEQQREFDEDSVVQKTTNAYNSIVTSQMKIDKAARDLAVKTKQLNDAKLKNNLGLLTEVDLQANQIQIQNLQYAQNYSQNQLKDAIYSFKVLTGKDVTQYSLEQDIQFDKLKIDGDVDAYFDEVIDKDLKYKVELNKITKEYYNDHDNQVSERNVQDAKTKTDGATAPVAITGETLEQYMARYNQYEQDKSAYSNALSARLGYLSTKLSMDTTDISLNMTKKQLKDTLRTLYTNLLAQEDKINSTKSSIELTNKQLSNAKLKYDLGLMTKSDYDTLVVNSLDLNIQLRSAIDSYNTLKEEIQKPWIAAGGAASSGSGNAGA